MHSLIHTRRNRRSAKALDRHSAKLCVLARDVDSDEYKTLVTALCKEGNVPLLYIDSREKLGEFVGLAKVRATRRSESFLWQLSQKPRGVFVVPWLGLCV